jgi:hypothetical protein
MHFNHDATQEGAIYPWVGVVLVAEKQEAFSIIIVTIVNHILSQPNGLANVLVLLKSRLKWGDEVREMRPNGKDHDFTEQAISGAANADRSVVTKMVTVTAFLVKQGRDGVFHVSSHLALPGNVDVDLG